jgi:hypothetical protein
LVSVSSRGLHPVGGLEKKSTMLPKSPWMLHLKSSEASKMYISTGEIQEQKSVTVADHRVRAMV